MGVVSHSCLVLFGDNGICVLCVLISVGALFYFRRVIVNKKTLSIKDVEKMLEKSAEKITKNINCEKLKTLVKF